MKPTPHLIAAAVIVLLAAVISLPALFAGGGSFPVDGTVPKVIAPVPALLPGNAAVEPLVAAYERPGDGNPFTLRRGGREKGGPRINLPPPPPLEVPAPPLLPIPEVAP